MLVREIMTAPAFHVDADAPLDEALRLMARRRVTALPVTEGGARLVGVVSEIDVLRRAVRPDARAHARPLADDRAAGASERVRDIMTTQARTTVESADVADLVTLFATSSFKSLPVVRGDDLIGVVSRSDVIRALWRDDDEVRDDVLAAFDVLGQDAWTIAVHDGTVEVSGPTTPREADIAAAVARTVLGVRRVQVTGMATSPGA